MFNFLKSKFVLAVLAVFSFSLNFSVFAVKNTGSGPENTGCGPENAGCVQEVAGGSHFEKVYNKIVGALSAKKRIGLDIKNLFAYYVKECPCSCESIEQINRIIEAFEKEEVNCSEFKYLLFCEQTYNKIMQIDNDDDKLNAFLEFMRLESRHNVCYESWLCGKNHLELEVDEENHNIIFKVKLEDWGGRIYLNFPLKKFTKEGFNQNFI